MSVNTRRRRIGARRMLFVIETPLHAPDGFGGFTRSWQAGPAVWGALETLRFDERRIADRIEEVATHRLHLRRRDPPQAGARFRLGARVFDLRASEAADRPGRDVICLVEEIKAVEIKA
ncbi:MAG: head-tail adaptor protein [Salinarimonas sp.]|nr:head-tail adaptor protein [Salinarimonas sp.]